MNQKQYQKKFWEDAEREKRRTLSHPVVAAFVKPKIDFILKHIEIKKTTTLLDVGCGNGFFTFYFEKICDATGVDFSEKMLSLNPCSKLVLGNAQNLPFLDNSFDIVFCSNLLHHLDNVGAALNEMNRVSKKYIVVIEPNRNNPLFFLFGLLKKEERKSLIFTKKYLARQGKKNGLKVRTILTTGLIFPNKTRTPWIPFLKKFDKPMPSIGGAYIEIIFEK